MITGKEAFDRMRRDTPKMGGTAREFVAATMIIAGSGYVWNEKEKRLEFKVAKMSRVVI